MGPHRSAFAGHSGEARRRRGGSHERRPVREAREGARFVGGAMEDKVKPPDLAAEASSATAPTRPSRLVLYDMTCWAKTKVVTLGPAQLAAPRHWRSKEL